jgi:hypothetical protein
VLSDPAFSPPLVGSLEPRLAAYLILLRRRLGDAIERVHRGPGGWLQPRHQPAAGAFGPYARTAVHRACWRYVVSPRVQPQRLAGTVAQHFALAGTQAALEDVDLELAWHSAEEEVMAREVGAFESAAGMMMSGWSTALLVAVVQRTDRRARP